MEKPHRKGFLKCNGIGKIWYGMLTVSLQIYVHYDEIEDYMEFKSQVNDPRYGLLWDERPGTICLMMTMLSLATLPFFLYSSLVRTGNLVNDFIRLGGCDRSELVSSRSLVLERLEKARDRANDQSCWRILKYYAVPSCQSLHFMSAFLLLIPLSFLNGERMKNSAISFDCLWISDIHRIFNVKDPGTLTIVRRESETLRFPIATLNYIVATIFLSINTSTVFWNMSKSFAVLIGFFDLIISASFLIINSAVSVAIRYYSMKGLDNSGTVPLYSQWQCIVMLTAAFLWFLVCRNLVFEFGLQRYVIAQHSLNQMVEDNRIPSISTGILRNSWEFKDRIRNQIQSFWLNAIGFLVWIIEAGCLIPIACFLVTVYWSTTKLFFILGFIAVTVVMVTWFSTWMLLSIKHDWMFKVQPFFTVLKDKSQPPEPIYTCFHGKKQLSHASLISKIDNNAETYSDNIKWGKSDIYQIFKAPSEYNCSRIPSVSSIPSHFTADQLQSTYQTVHRQQNIASLLNEIDENGQLEERSHREASPLQQSVLSPLFKVRSNGGIMSPKNFVLHSNQQSNSFSLADSAYQSSRLKNYSQDSLRSMTFANRRRQHFDISDYGRIDNVAPGNYGDTGSNHGMYPGNKDYMADDNTDISTDFSDQNTNSSGADTKTTNKNRYYPPPYHYHSNMAMIGDQSDEMYLQQTGV